MYYAGVGSRETPAHVCKQMTELAKRLESFGLTLRSGGAKGADKAFEAGAPTTSESYRVSGMLINRLYVRYEDK
jgi:predicted Rossmann fold nucleotide-binding protein DprA/Smf involved in DNA uptake